MKKLLFVLLTVLMALPSFTACQKTPESPIVVGKSNEALIDKAIGYEGGESLIGRIDAPSTYASNFVSADNTISVAMDATVTVPEAKSAAIIRVSSGVITQEQADVLIQTLVHTDLYDPYATPSKNVVMQRILLCEQQLAAGPSDDDLSMTYYDNSGNPLSWEEWMRQTVNGLYKEYHAASDDAEAAAISGRFETDDGGLALIYGEGISAESGYEGLQIQNGQGLGNSRALYTHNTAPDGFSMHYELPGNVSRLYPAVDITSIPDIKITEAEARQICDELTSKLDIPGMTHYSTCKKYGGGTYQSPPRCCWALQYTRSIDGLPVTYTAVRGDTMTDAGVYNEPWAYETLTYFVNDDGIVGLWWEAPYEAIDIVSNDSALLSFADMMGIFEKMFTVANAGLNKTVTIQNIRFGYARIAEQNKVDSALLVPAWDFFGTVEDANGTVIDDPEKSLFTINAIDGSIIDRSLGY